jgi:putative proteasome-type protease
LPSGLVLASDSRSNAGIDQIQAVRKLEVLAEPGRRLIAIQSAGNLATTQSVISNLKQALGRGVLGEDLYGANTMFEAAQIVGDMLRRITDRDAHYVQPYGDVSASFLVSGQIVGEAPRLFEVYQAGNFVEASQRSAFLQIGETKYGKPILDRALNPDNSLDEAAKLALLSFDATIRSNLSVGLPIDMLRYETDSFSAVNLVTIPEHNAYWRELRRGYGEGLTALVAGLPAPPSAEALGAATGAKGGGA